MNPYEKIKELTKRNGISVRELEKRLGYSNGYFSKWRNVSPNSDGLAKVADYFNVSIDYLLDRSIENTNSSSFISDTDLDDVLDGVMSWNGEMLTEADKEAVRTFLAGRKSK